MLGAAEATKLGIWTTGGVYLLGLRPGCLNEERERALCVSMYTSLSMSTVYVKKTFNVK